MTTIAIIGAGIAGAHLGLFLERLGIGCTLYSDVSPATQRADVLRSATTHFAPLLARERGLGLGAWDQVAVHTEALHVHVQAGPASFSFTGVLDEPALCIDHRIHIPLLVEDYVRRGGRLESRHVGDEDLPRLAAEHDLVVVCTGRGGLTRRFPVLDELSPYAQPQRRIVSGVYRGVHPLERPGLSLCITEHGELFITPFHTAEGPLSIVSIEARVGGPLEPLTHRRYLDDPKGFERELLQTFADHAPALREQLDDEQLALTRPEDLLQGAVRPLVRRGHARLDEHTSCLAIGDAHFNNDPIGGQGANAASRSAWILSEAIAAALGRGAPLDSKFCHDVARELWDASGPACRFTNALLGPPNEQLGQIMGTAASDPAVANAFANNFAHPKQAWNAIATPEHTARFLASFAASSANGQAVRSVAS